MLPNNNNTDSAKDHMEKLNSQSNKYREVNDQLSSVLQHYEDLRPPNIVVLGEQSAGKSSVLEYLSGIRFVTGQDMVTKCPLQLRMTRSNSEKSVAVVKSNGHEPVEIVNPQSGEGAKTLEQVIKTISDSHVGSGTVSNELIEVHVNSPHVPDLTLVDLPGLITASSKDSPTLADDIRRLVLHNITERDCILIVGDAGRDLQTIVGFKEADEKDNEQKRTLCVLTKVDKCINDRELREKLIKSLNNKGSISLLHGFITVKNRTSEEKDKSIEECEEFEKKLLSSLEAPPSTKGRFALIEKLTAIQNEHLEESIPKQKELLLLESRKVDNQIQEMSRNVVEFQRFGEESLINIYEDYTTQLISEFKDFSENKENFQEENSLNDVSLSVFTTHIDKLSNSLSEFLNFLTVDDISKYYLKVTKFIERGKGYPGLPDLYQPTIIRDLVKVELQSMKVIVDNEVFSILETIKSILLDHLVPQSVDSKKVEKLITSELSARFDSAFEQVQKEISTLFRREYQRTVTLNDSYALNTNLMNHLHRIKTNTQTQTSIQEEKFVEAQLKQLGCTNEISLVNVLAKMGNEGMKHSAAVEILIKFKSYIRIVRSRLVDTISQLLYDDLIMTPVEEMKHWLKVKRTSSTSTAPYASHSTVSNPDHEALPGIPFHRIVEIMKPSKSDLLVLERLLQKREDIKKALSIIDKLNYL